MTHLARHVLLWRALQQQGLSRAAQAAPSALLPAPCRHQHPRAEGGSSMHSAMHASAGAWPCPAAHTSTSGRSAGTHSPWPPQPPICAHGGASTFALQGMRGIASHRGFSTSAGTTRAAATAAVGPGGSGPGASGSPGAAALPGAGAPPAHLDVPPVIISPQPCRVVLIGWMGSKRRYLQKYAGLWRRSGEHEVLSLRTSIPMTLMRWRGVVTAGNDIDRVARLHIENPAMPTIYHIFSTGGFIHAGTMWRWMDQVEDHVLRQDLLGEVKGIIFDSAPSKVNEDMASRAIASALLGTPAEDFGRQPLASALASGAKGALSWYLQRPSIKLREEEVYDAWYEMAPTCPQLYLYSDGDVLVPPRDVEEYMQLQESRGVEVFGHRWRDSGHCEHYRKHPHEYAFQISQFMSHCLRDW